MAGSEYYDHTTFPSQGAAGSSAAMRSELENVESGFGKLPALAGNGSKVVAVNSAGTALEAIRVTQAQMKIKTVVALADAAATLTAAQMIDSAIFTITPTVARILTTDTAVNIVAAIPDYQVGTWFDFTIVNTAAFDVTLAAGTGITLSGSNVIHKESATWKARIDSATAITIYNTAAMSSAPGVAAFLATPSSANLIAAVTDETGSGPLVFASSIQAQTNTAFTTAGTATAYTLTPSPALAALAAGQRFRVKFNAANGAAPTLAVSGLAATALKVYDSTGAKIAPPAGTLALNMLSDVEYDGTDWVVLDRVNLAASGANSDITSLSALTSINGGSIGGTRNKLINGNFGINQRGVSGTVVLSAGAYGHDRFKAGASGCTYTFATSNNVTTITISEGSLQQVVEGLNLQSGTHVLSWAGTAQGRIDGGSYGASGAVTATAVGGTNMTVEFNTGTLSKAQLEEGSLASTFEQRLASQELVACQRYYELVTKLQSGVAAVAGTQYATCYFRATKRATPTVSFTSGGVTNINVINVDSIVFTRANDPPDATSITVSAEL